MNEAQTAPNPPIAQDSGAENRAITEVVQDCPMCSHYYRDVVKHGPIEQIPKERAVPLLMDFIASSGRALDENGELAARMSMDMFAHLIGWSKRMLYYWIDADPDWDAKVLRRIPIIFGSPKRVARVVTGIFAAASGGDNRSGETYLRNFWTKEYKSPTAKLEHDVGNNLADLIKNAQKRNADAARRANAIDATPST